MNGVADTINRTEAQVGKQFRVLTVSFDERDMPEMAARKRSNYLQEVKRPIAPTDWRFLTGDAITTKKLAAEGRMLGMIDTRKIDPQALKTAYVVGPDDIFETDAGEA